MDKWISPAAAAVLIVTAEPERVARVSLSGVAMGLDTGTSGGMSVMRAMAEIVDWCKANPPPSGFDGDARRRPSDLYDDAMERARKGLAAGWGCKAARSPDGPLEAVDSSEWRRLVLGPDDARLPQKYASPVLFSVSISSDDVLNAAAPAPVPRRTKTASLAGGGQKSRRIRKGKYDDNKASVIMVLAGLKEKNGAEWLKGKTPGERRELVTKGVKDKNLPARTRLDEWINGWMRDSL